METKVIPDFPGIIEEIESDSEVLVVAGLPTVSVEFVHPRLHETLRFETYLNRGFSIPAAAGHPLTPPPGPPRGATRQSRFLTVAESVLSDVTSDVSGTELRDRVARRLFDYGSKRIHKDLSARIEHAVKLVRERQAKKVQKPRMEAQDE